ncbi:MAG: flagellin modification protein A [Proteobacteria bacterium]|nr:flagellin modification protein A [Pseudomonadota bacterium]MBU1688669.1 flagellin modification protein A [Pseudomonadota bacterium]
MLKDKVVIVTGGAGLLGKAFLKGIARQRGVGIIADINSDLGHEAILLIQQEVPHARVDLITVDITSKESVREMIKEVRGKHGKIDALVNNAYPRNQNFGRRFEDVEYEDFCDNVSRHLGGYFLVAQQIAEYFKDNGGGSIINLASIYGAMAPRFKIYRETSMTMPVEYAAIKSAIIQLTRYIARYYQGCGIHVNAISPGGILDNQPDRFIESYNSHCLTKGMLGENDIVGTLLFLLSDSSRYINGQNIIVDDGFSL